MSRLFSPTPQKQPQGLSDITQMVHTESHCYQKQTVHIPHAFPFSDLAFLLANLNSHQLEKSEMSQNCKCYGLTVNSGTSDYANKCCRIPWRTVHKYFQLRVGCRFLFHSLCVWITLIVSLLPSSLHFCPQKTSSGEWSFSSSIHPLLIFHVSVWVRSFFIHFLTSVSAVPALSP